MNFSNPAPGSRYSCAPSVKSTLAAFLTVFAILFCGAATPAQTPIVTQHNDNARTGAYTTESILTPANVNQNSFGKLFTYAVDGRTYAQPLYVPNLTIPGKGTHNVIFIATEHDSVYAFDADSNGGANASPLWKITLLDAAHGAPAGATTVPNGDISSGDIIPEIGITGTPVIDLSTNTMYLVGKTKEGPTTYVQRFHALDITTGAEKFGGPVTITASVSGSGTGSSGGVLSFDPKWQMNRAGLLLQNGVVYFAFGSHGDNGPWHGWLFAYSASTMQKLSVFCTSSNGFGSGTWMAGTGLAGDVIDPVNKPFGRVFIPTGNGTFDATTPYTNSMDYGDDMIRLDATNGVLTVQDSFTPFNQAALSEGDADLASGGILLLPDQSVGGHTHLLVQAGKEGKIYLVDRDNMGGFNSSVDNIVQEIPNPNNQNFAGGLWSAPAFWNNTLYTWPVASGVRAYSLTNGKLSTSPISTGSASSAFPGATPAISANGNTNGIVWVVQTDGYNAPTPAILRAYNATNLTTELYDSNQNAARDGAGNATKFVVPTIANGKVYIASAGNIHVYGLLAGAPTAAVPVINPASQTFTNSISVTITDSTPGATIYYTTDGTVPTTASTVYTGSITVTTTKTITAIASASGFVQSAPASQTYTAQNQVAAPTFLPAGGTIASPISVTLSDSTPGASIYYTTNGTTPTTASALYSTPIAVNSTTTINAIAAASGMTNSPVSSATYTLSTGTGSNFVNGFSGALNVMTFNGSTQLADTRLQLTNGLTFQAGSAWFNTPLNVQSFVNDFTFQIANPVADGFTFTIQNTALTALGFYGGGLGYGSDSATGPIGIGNSVAIKFDFYDNNGEGSDSTGLYRNGVTPTIPAVSLLNTGIDLTSGDTFSVHMVYDGTTLTMTITDGVTNATFTTSWNINIPQVIGSNTAYVGFTGGTGGGSSSQKIETWNFTPTTQSSSQTAKPTFSLAAGTYLGTQTVSLSDATQGATIFYTIDGTTPATSVGGSTAQYTGPLTVTSTRTINAIATAPSLSPSVVASATYTIQTQVAAPTFNPGGGTYPSTQTVTISTTTPGAAIFYTLDGSTPTTSATGSTVAYAGPIAVNVNTTIKALATASGFFASNVSSAAYTITSSGGNTINFGSGFVGGGMIFNGGAALNGTRLRVTDGGLNEATSAWYNTPVSVTSFTNDFSFQITPGTSPMADGFAFVIQANGTTARGPLGGALGYGDLAGNTSISIANSVAIKFDLYSNSGESNNSTGIYTNGGAPTTPYVTLSGIDLHSGHVFNAHITYDGATLSLTLTDTVTAATFTKTWPIGIASTINANTAYFGFTGGTGGYTAIQDIISWTYSSGSAAPAAATPTFSPAAGSYASAQNVTISDTTAGAAIFYTTDGSTPTPASTKYVGPVSVAASSTLKAIATAAGFSTSAVGSAAYVIQTAAATPTFSPAAGNYTSAQNVTISDATTGATILYTTDGSTPTTASTLYSGPIAVGANTTIKAIAVASGFANSAVATAAYVINLPAATPTFNPVAGTYTSAQTVTISDSTAGATIFYTTNGSTPTTASTIYTTPISVAASTTVKAIATATGFSTSAVGSAAYVIQTAAATPTFSPVAGTYASAQNVTISDTTAGANIFYTIDGSTPTTASTRYTGAIPVGATTTIKAMATATGFNNSVVASATYTINLPAATPTFSPVAGTYTTAQNVTISDSTAGASIFYTTDGSTPTTASTKYVSPVTVASNLTIKAIATATGFSTSAVGSAAYVIQTAAATPTFSPVAGTYTTTQNVTISDSTAGASIFYTTDGSTPTTASTKYVSPIAVTATTTIKAIASATGFNNSSVASATYTIQPPAATPTFSPGGGTYASAQTVTISDTTAGATIYYTTNGSNPTTSSTKYTAPISIAATATLKAIATAPGFSTSAVAAAIYTIQTAAATPTFSPTGGNYASPVSVTLSDTTAGASIFFTTDGTTPTTASTRYTAPITVSATTTIKAIATATGFNNSVVASATYSIGTSTGIGFSGGFGSSAGLQFNGGSSLSGTRLRITDGGLDEGRSAFWTTPVSVQSFTTDFTFQQTPGTSPMADGFAFVLQNSGTTALGPAGGGLGYGDLTGSASGSILKSVAIKFDLYDNSGEGYNSTGLYTNGAAPSLPSIDLTSSGVNLSSGDLMRAHMTYDGTTLALTISDTVTGAEFTSSWPINIPGVIGSSTAYAGFTGGTGGYTAVQDVVTWNYTPGAPKPNAVYSTTALSAVSSGPTFRTFAYSGFPDGNGTILDATAVGDSVSFTVNVAQAGIYDVSYTTKDANSRGKMQLAINGSNTGPVTDQYAPADGFAQYDLGNFNFTAAGNYTFRFTVTGKNASSTSDSMAFDDIILTPQ